MDYSKLTKQELLDIVSEQQTLADAVDAKDKEIALLKEKLKTFEGSMKREEVRTHTKQLEETAKKAQDIANQYIRAHRDLMRIFKVNLDFAISHEDLLAEKLK